MNPIVKKIKIDDFQPLPDTHPPVEMAHLALGHLQVIAQCETKTFFLAKPFQEPDNVAALAKEFFKEEVYQALHKLSKEEKWHFFRFMQLSKMSWSPNHQLTLLEMPKAKLERMIYRPLLLPLLRERVKKVEEELQLCITELTSIPPRMRDSYLADFEKLLKFFPSLQTGLHLLLNARKNDIITPHLTWVEPFKHIFKKVEDLISFLNDLKSLSPDTREKALSDYTFYIQKFDNDYIDIKDTFAFVKDNDPRILYDFLSTFKPLDKFHSTRRSREMYELANLLAAEPVKKERLLYLWNLYIEAFPKLKLLFEPLLLELSQRLEHRRITAALKFQKTIPFSRISYGLHLALFIQELSQADEVIKIGKFLWAFPYYATDFYKKLMDSPHWEIILTSAQKYSIYEHRIRDILPKILTLSKNQIEPRLKLFQEYTGYFPFISHHDQLFDLITQSRQTPFLIRITPWLKHIPFYSISDLVKFLDLLEPVLAKDLRYNYNKSVTDQPDWFYETYFKTLHERLYGRFTPEELKENISTLFKSLYDNRGVWLYLCHLEKGFPFDFYLNHITELELAKFRDHDHRDATVKTYFQLAKMKSLEAAVFPFLRDHPEGEALARLMCEYAPWISVIKVEQLELLSKVQSAQRIELLKLMYKHWENAFNIKFDLIEIPIEGHKQALSTLEELQLNEIEEYEVLIKNLAKATPNELREVIKLYKSLRAELPNAAPKYHHLLLCKLLEQTSYSFLDFPWIKKIRPGDHVGQIKLLTHFLFFPPDLPPKIMEDLKRFEKVPLDSFLIDLPLLIPHSLLATFQPGGSKAEEFYQELYTPLNQEAIHTHLASLLDRFSHDLVFLNQLLNKIDVFEMDYNTSLGLTIIQYRALLADDKVQNPWILHQTHINRLSSNEMLPYPAIDGFRFNYQKLRPPAAIRAEQLPKEINFATLKKLIQTFLKRYGQLNKAQQTEIIAHLNSTMELRINSEILTDVQTNSWWRNKLDYPPAGPVPDATWKLVVSLEYILEQDTQCGTEVPDREAEEKIKRTPGFYQLSEREQNKKLNAIEARNFALQEKLLSNQEKALLKLIGQVQYCNTGKENGLNQFIKFLPNRHFESASNAQQILSEAIRTYLNFHIISTDWFVNKLLQVDKIAQLLHHSKYIRNTLSKELKYPLEFDAHSHTLHSKLLIISPQELLAAVFAEVKLPSLSQAVAEELNKLDFASEEGIELYQQLRNSAPNIKKLCLFDDEELMVGITPEAIPYLLKQYGYLQKF